MSQWGKEGERGYRIKFTIIFHLQQNKHKIHENTTTSEKEKKNTL